MAKAMDHAYTTNASAQPIASNLGAKDDRPFVATVERDYDAFADIEFDIVASVNFGSTGSSSSRLSITPHRRHRRWFRCINLRR